MSNIRTIDVIEWKYGAVADTRSGKITGWRHPRLPQPDEIQLAADREEYIAHLAKTLYKEKRRSEYPSVEDQLDAIWKGGQEAQDMKARIEAVKAKYPKPV